MSSTTTDQDSVQYEVCEHRQTLIRMQGRLVFGRSRRKFFRVYHRKDAHVDLKQAHSLAFRVINGRIDVVLGSGHSPILDPVRRFRIIQRDFAGYGIGR